jgi:F-type H+-transporting ATPase subunit b
MTHVPFAVLAEGETAPSPLAPNLTELIVGLVAFAILFFFLRAKVFPKFEETFRARSEAIEGGIKRAEQAQAEAAQLKADFQRQLAQSRSEAAQELERARAEAAQIVEEARVRAQAEADRIMARADEQIQAERAQVAAQLRTEIGSLSVQLASRIVGESLDDQARQSRVVDRFLSELETEGSSASGTR